MKETILDSMLRTFRISRVLPVIKQFKDCNILDIGCGWEARLLKELEPFINKGIGLHMVDSNKIRDHKRYFNKCDIKELFESVGFIIERHKYFQFGMNNFCVLMKGYNL